MLQGRTSLLDQSGQTAVEYAGVLALVAILIVLAFTPIPTNLFGSFWTAVQSALS